MGAGRGPGLADGANGGAGGGDESIEFRSEGGGGLAQACLHRFLGFQQPRRRGPVPGRGLGRELVERLVSLIEESVPGRTHIARAGCGAGVAQPGVGPTVAAAGRVSGCLGTIVTNHGQDQGARAHQGRQTGNQSKEARPPHGVTKALDVAARYQG